MLVTRLEAGELLRRPGQVSAGAVAVVELGEPVLKSGVVPAPVLHELEQIVGRQGAVPVDRLEDQIVEIGQNEPRDLRIRRSEPKASVEGVGFHT